MNETPSAEGPSLEVFNVIENKWEGFLRSNFSTDFFLTPISPWDRGIVFCGFEHIYW